MIDSAKIERSNRFFITILQEMRYSLSAYSTTNRPLIAYSIKRCVPREIWFTRDFQTWGIVILSACQIFWHDLMCCYYESACTIFYKVSLPELTLESIYRLKLQQFLLNNGIRQVQIVES